LRSAAPESPALRPLPGELARRLRDFLFESSYDEGTFRDVLGEFVPPFPHTRHLPRMLHRTREPTVFNVLARWFALGVPVDAGTASTVLPSWFLEACGDAGLLRSTGSSLEPTALMLPFGKLLIASDPYSRLLSSLETDHVLAVSPTAWTLLNFTIQHRRESTLDLCTGSGLLAIATSTSSRSVVATDLNPRATVFAQFNARLNGRDNVELLTGDGFEPVRGDLFDLIVCNPPFVLSPTSRYLYRDNDQELDLFCRALVRRAPGHLREGGYFQMIFEWAGFGSQSWRDGVADWFDGSGCDVWLMRTYTREVSEYAHTRILETPFESFDEDKRAYDEWMAYYRRNRVECVHGGLLAMRRREGKNWIRMDEIPESEQMRRPFGEAVFGGFAARDFLDQGAAGEGLMDATLLLPTDVRLDQEIGRAAGTWRSGAIRMRREAGLPLDVGVDRNVVEFLSSFDGTRTVREAIREAASRSGAALDKAAAECLPLVRRLTEHAFLVPVASRKAGDSRDGS